MSTTDLGGWPHPGAYATTADVAEYLSVEVSTIQRWARQGVLEAIRMGGHNGPMRFRKLGVEKWASRQPRACA